jgi:hypothetical protein
MFANIPFLPPVLPNPIYPAQPNLIGFEGKPISSE